MPVAPAHYALAALIFIAIQNLIPTHDQQISGKPVHRAYQFAPRRAGDVAQCFADAALAHQLLGWRATHTLADMCADAWRWQSGNPDGYV